MSEQVRVEGEATTSEPRRREDVIIRLPDVGAIAREVLGDEFIKHMRAAGREQLLALRCLVDRAIERTDEMDRQARARRTVDIKIEH